MRVLRSAASRACRFFIGAIVMLFPCMAFGWSLFPTPLSRVDYYSGQLVDGDFNDDGKKDLVAMGSDHGSLILGLGDGRFGLESRFATGIGPIAATAADFNHDGHLDVAVANYSSGDVSFLAGRGDGTFVSQTRWPVGGNPVAIAAADFNEDGRMDLAVGSASNDVSILLGAGDGTFAGPVQFQAGYRSSAIAVSDLNADGHADLVTANGDSDDLSILLGTGNGGFASEVRYAAGRYPWSLAVADYDNDGANDIVVVSAGDGALVRPQISLLRNNKNGTFQQRELLSIGAPGPGRVVAGDFDDDGRIDLAVSVFGPREIAVALGAGDGAFGAERRYVNVYQPGPLVLADFDGDGALDLATAGSGPESNSNNLGVLRGLGDGSFGPQSRFGVGSARSMTVGDFNKDGLDDLAVADAGEFDCSSGTCVQLAGAVSIVLGQPGGRFSAESRMQAGFGPSSIASADLDGDSNEDLVTTNTDSNDVSIFMGDGHGHFAESRVATGDGPVRVVISDFNGDASMSRPA